MTVISLRLSPEEIDILKAAAAADKLKLGTWIKQAAMKAVDAKAAQPLPAIQAQSVETTPPLMP